MTEGQIALTVIWIIGGLLWAAGFGAQLHLQHQNRMSGDDPRRTARLFLAAPVWPLVVLVLFVRLVVIAVRMAREDP